MFLIFKNLRFNFWNSFRINRSLLNHLLFHFASHFTLKFTHRIFNILLIYTRIKSKFTIIDLPYSFSLNFPNFIPKWEITNFHFLINFKQIPLNPPIMFINLLLQPIAFLINHTFHLVIQLTDPLIHPLEPIVDDQNALSYLVYFLA